MNSFTATSGDMNAYISYAAAKGTASTAPVVNSNQIRVYQNGGTFTVSAKNGAKITGVVLGSSMATTVTYAVDGGEVSSNQTISANDTFTLSDIEATENVLFTCTGTTSSSRLYVNYLKVIYTAGSTKTPTTLAWSASAATATIGAADNEFPTLSVTPAGLSGVTYESSNTAAATINVGTGVITLVGAGSTTITASYAGNDTYLPATPASYALTVKAAPVADDYIHDVLTNADFAATGTTYTDFSGVKKNTAVYAGNSAKNNGIQLRSNNSNSGIVTTTSGGNIKKVVVSWNSNCADGRVLDIYGKNTPYTNASDLYNSATQGTKLGSVTKGTTTELVISDDYNYVGVRSNSGALNIDEIEFVWDENGSVVPPVQYAVAPTLTASAVFSTTPFDVTITNNEEGATVYYTTDGNNPTTESASFTGASKTIQISETTTVKAMAVVEGKENSTVVSTTYTYEAPVDITNTPETAYTVAEAIALIDAGKGLSQGVYVKGIVSKIVTAYSEQYGNITFNVSADGKEEGQQFQFYRNQKDASSRYTEDPNIEVGAEVIGYGTMKKYVSGVNVTYEFNAGNYLVSYKAPETSGKLTPTITISPDFVLEMTEGESANYEIEYDGDGTLSITSSSVDVAKAVLVGTDIVVSAEAAGTATIIISSTETDKYKAGELTYNLKVNAKLDNLDYNAVVSQFGGKSYAMGSTVDNKTLNAVEVNTVNGKVVNVSADDKDALSWALTTAGNVVNKAGEYVSFNKADVSLGETTTSVFTEAEDGIYWVSSNRAFIYRESANGFKTYATSNAEASGYGTVGYLMPFVDGYVRDITLAEGQEVKYGTICLDRTIEAADLAGATFYSIAGKKVNANDVVTSIVLEEETEGLIAGYPYIFAATANVVAAYTGDVEATAAEANNGLVGSFEGIGVAEGMYLITNNTVKKCGTGCKIGANRAYINMDDVPPYTATAGAKVIELTIEGETTGISNVEFDNSGVQESRIYNLAGQRVNASAKGMLIKNGKKYLVK